MSALGFSARNGNSSTKATLAARLRRLQTYQRASEDLAIKVAFARLAILPRSYVLIKVRQCVPTRPGTPSKKRARRQAGQPRQSDSYYRCTGICLQGEWQPLRGWRSGMDLAPRLVE